MSESKRSKPGRPAIGVAVPVRMTPAERVVADLLGGGRAAQGVRLALAAAAVLGPEAIREAASRWRPPVSPVNQDGDLAGGMSDEQQDEEGS